MTTAEHPAVDGSTVRPTSPGEAADALRSSTGSVLFRGGGTALDWAGRVDDPALVLDTRGMDRLLTYEPSDLTCSVGAGMTLAALQETLGEQGQMIALDPPSEAAGATLGGLLASGDAGPSRLRYGGMRDLVIGVTLVLTDGTVAHAGSHVIKNVAGYDLAKLAYGSLGSLALVAEVILRLHPKPELRRTTAATATVEQATEAALALMAGPREPAAVEWTGAPDGPGRLLVRFEGLEAGVAAQEAALRQLLAEHGLEPADPGGDEAQVWQEHARAVVGEDGETVIRVSGLPTALPAVAADVRAALQGTGTTATLLSSVALGLQTLRVGGGTPAEHAAVVEQVRARALGRGATVLVRRRPAEVDAHLDVLGPPPSVAPLLRRVKAELDPGGRAAPGRFRPWY